MGLGDINSIHLHKKHLNQPSGETNGAPGMVPPPCPSKAKPLLVKFPAPEKRGGWAEGALGSVRGRKAQTFPGSSRDRWRRECENRGVVGSGQEASQGRPFAP